MGSVADSPMRRLLCRLPPCRLCAEIGFFVLHLIGHPAKRHTTPRRQAGWERFKRARAAARSGRTREREERETERRTQKRHGDASRAVNSQFRFAPAAFTPRRAQATGRHTHRRRLVRRQQQSSPSPPPPPPRAAAAAERLDAHPRRRPARRRQQRICPPAPFMFCCFPRVPALLSQSDPSRPDTIRRRHHHSAKVCWTTSTTISRFDAGQPTGGAGLHIHSWSTTSAQRREQGEADVRRSSEEERLDRSGPVSSTLEMDYLNEYSRVWYQWAPLG